MGHYVYKYVYGEEIVYIGKCDSSLKVRISQHKGDEKFKIYLDSEIFYIELANKTMTDVVESELIRRYKPKLNEAKMSDWSGLEFKEPEWKRFEHDKKGLRIIKTRCSNTSMSKRKTKRMKICKLMSQYYCPMMIKNIPNMYEDDSCYEIKIPISNEDDNQECCVPPYIFIDNKNTHGGMSLGICCCDNENVIYKFDKKRVLEEFYDIEKGLIQRIQYMKNMFEKELKEYV